MQQLNVTIATLRTMENRCVIDSPQSMRSEEEMMVEIIGRK